MNDNPGAREDVTVFWDFETSPSLSSVAAISTYEMVKSISSAIAMYGPLKSIRLYWDYGSHPFPSTTMSIRSEFSASGVSLIDCPAEGRKGAAIKKMLVDMLFQAWDSPSPTTIVVITEDRDVAYALAMLRMKSYRVVLISPAGSHPDLTSQASVHMDWSRTILGINGGSNEDGLFPKESPDPISSSAPAPTRSSASSRPGHAVRSELPSATLRDSPAPALKPSVFSSPYDHGLNLFGGPRYTSPKFSFGLGDSSFPLPQLANQKLLRSRSGSLTELLRPTPLASKGKNKASEPEDIELYPPPASRSRLWSSASIFGRFDDDDNGLPNLQSSPAAPAGPDRAISSNSSGSQRSKFSFEHISKPLVNTTEPVDERPRTSSTEEPARLSSSPRAAEVTAPSVVQRKTKQRALPLPLPQLPPPRPVVVPPRPVVVPPRPVVVPPRPVVVPPRPVVVPPATPQRLNGAASRKSAQLPRVSGTSKPKPKVSSKSLPGAWVPLIQTLRRHNGVLSRSTIAPTLLTYYPNAFKTAGATTIKPYLEAAIKAGIVSKHPQSNGPAKIHLTLPYLS